MYFAITDEIMNHPKTVEEYIEKSGKYKSAMTLLREVILQTDLIEAVKWGMPCYTINNKNVIGIAAFKKYVGIWFHQGVFLKDEQQKLVNAQEGVTKALRQWRFTDVKEIKEHLDLLKLYIEEAIENQKLGKELKFTQKKELVIPVLLREFLDSNKRLNSIFKKLPLSHKREYCEYISEAKKETTQQRRLKKIESLMLEGKGLNDKYRRS